MPQKKEPAPVAVPNYDEVWTTVYGGMQNSGPTHHHMRRLLRRLLRPLKYESVLEVGCGAGHNFPLLTEGRSLSRLSGIDISAEALQRARQVMPQGEFHQLDIELAHLEGTWDLVFCSLVLEHLPQDVAALRNMRAMTGRHLVATTIAGDFERYRRWDERLGHVRNYARGELESKLEQVGFKVRQAVYWGFPFYSPFARTLQSYSSVGTGNFGVLTQALAKVLTGLYYLNSGRRGDLLLVVCDV